MLDLFGRPDDLILEKVQSIIDVSVDRGKISRETFTMTVAAGTAWQLIYTFNFTERVRLNNIFIDFTQVLSDLSLSDIDYKITMENLGTELMIGTTEADNTLINGDLLNVIDVLNYNSLDPSGPIRIYARTSNILLSDRAITIINLYEILGGAL